MCPLYGGTRGNGRAAKKALMRKEVGRGLVLPLRQKILPPRIIKNVFQGCQKRKEAMARSSRNRRGRKAEKEAVPAEAEGVAAVRSPRQPSPAKDEAKMIQEAADLAAAGGAPFPPTESWGQDDYPRGFALLEEGERRQSNPAESTFPLVAWPIAEYRDGMVLFCPCGGSHPPNHFAACVVARADGGFLRVVLHRAYAMQQALLKQGYPVECVPAPVVPPVLPQRLLVALTDKVQAKSGAQIMAKWVPEEEERVMMGSFGDYAAHMATPEEEYLTVGSKRERRYDSAGKPLVYPLPWQTPLAMLVEARQKRLSEPLCRKLSASKHAELEEVEADGPDALLATFYRVLEAQRKRPSVPVPSATPDLSFLRRFRGGTPATTAQVANKDAGGELVDTDEEGPPKKKAKKGPKAPKPAADDSEEEEEEEEPKEEEEEGSVDE